MVYAIKAEVSDPDVGTFAFQAQKTMYGGKRIAAGDRVFVFASENEGGTGLVARGVVTAAHTVARSSSGGRETPRVSVMIAGLVRATRALGRRELEEYTAWGDGAPETELNFKFYRQATNKIVSISEGTAVFLEQFFQEGLKKSQSIPSAAKAALTALALRHG